MPRLQSVQMAVTILSAFEKRLCGLTEEEFDEAFDTVLDFLEKVNNEKFRCTIAEHRAEAPVPTAFVPVSAAQRSDDPSER